MSYTLAARCDDTRELAQDLPSQPMAPDRQPASIAIGEREPLPTQLASKDAILFHQIRDRLVLLAIQPAGQNDQHHLESGRVDHGWSLYHVAKLAARTGRSIVGHFYEAARQVTRFVVADSVIANRPPVSAHGSSTSQEMCARTGSSRLIVKPITSRGPSHFYARSVWHDIAPAHDTIRRRRRALYGTALDSGHMSSSH